MASSLTLTEVDEADIPTTAPTGKQIIYLNEVDAVAYIRDDAGVDLSLTAANEFQNIVYINKLSDFPAPVANVIELSPGVNTAYYITSVNIDISPNTLKCTGDSIYIKGMHPAESQITSSSTAPLIDAQGCSLRVEDIILENPNGDIFKFDGDGAITGFILDRVIIISCQNFCQDITGAIAASFNRVVALGTSVGGFSFTGSTNSQLLVRNNAAGLESGFLNWTGNFIDLQTATFDLIAITDNRVFPTTGNNFLTGAAGGANLNAGGSAILSDNIFKGAGTSVTTITGQDDNWNFITNSFNDGVRNTRSVADAYLTAPVTVTINAQDVYVPINGVNWASDISAHFTVGTDGLVTSTSVNDIDVSVVATSTIEKVGGGSDTLCMRIAYNGVDAIRTDSCTDNTAPTSVTSIGIVTMSIGDTLQLYVGNKDSTSNIIVSIANMVITGNMT